jgi:hypothetical protein
MLPLSTRALNAFPGRFFVFFPCRKAHREYNTSANIFLPCSCINSRRRRKRGLKPMYGTGWMANNQQGYQNNPHGYSNGYQNAPPAYGAPQGQSYPMQNQYTGNTFNANDGYYGQHEGIQQPKDAHTTANGNNAATGDYAPPPGPPPPGNKPAY